jgi:hypothetical protein
MADPAPSEALEALPDLTLADCCQRWEVSSRNAIKARAKALGVELRRESSTRTVWPAEHLTLGDELAKHLKKPGGTLANFGRSLTPPADGTDGDGSLVLEPRKGRPVPPQAPSLTPPTDGTDGLMALAQMALALRPPADPLAVPRALQEAAELGAWLSTKELAELVRMAPATVRGWGEGHSPRPGFRLVRKTDRGVWWKVVTDGTDGTKAHH